MPDRQAVSAKCRYVRRWISTLRSELYAAVSMERLLELLNGYLEDVGEDGVEGPLTRDDVAACLKDAKIVTKGGREVVLLWGPDDLIGKVVEAAAENGEAVIATWL